MRQNSEFPNVKPVVNVYLLFAIRRLKMSQTTALLSVPLFLCSQICCVGSNINSLKTQMTYMICLHKDLVHTSQKRHSCFHYKHKSVNVVNETTVFYYKNHSIHITTLCRKNVEFFYDTTGGKYNVQ